MSSNLNFLQDCTTTQLQNKIFINKKKYKGETSKLANQTETTLNSTIDEEILRNVQETSQKSKYISEKLQFKQLPQKYLHIVKIILKSEKIKNFHLNVSAKTLLLQLHLIERNFKDNLNELHLVYCKIPESSNKEIKFELKLKAEPKLRIFHDFFSKDLKDLNFSKFSELFEIKISPEEFKSDEYFFFIQVRLNKPAKQIDFLKDDNYPHLKKPFLDELEKSIKFPDDISKILIKSIKLKENSNQMNKFLDNENAQEILKFLKKFLFNNNSDSYLEFLTEFHSLVVSGIINFSNYEFIEIFIIEIISEKFLFNEFGNYINLFIYENCRKLKDAKNMDLIKKKIRDNKELNRNFEKFVGTLIARFNIYRNEYFKQVNSILYEKKKMISSNSNFIVVKNKSSSNLNSTMNAKQLLESSFFNCGNISDFDNTKDSSEINLSTLTDSLNISKDDNEISLEESEAFNLIVMILFLACRMKPMTELDLSQNQLTQESMLLILDSLKVNKSIKKLILSMNKIGSEGCWSVGRLFKYNLTNVRELDISSTLINDDNLKYFLVGVENSNTQLIKFNLSNNMLTVESGTTISEIIKKSPDLKHLNISKCPLEDGFNSIAMTILDSIREKKSNLMELLAYQIKMDPKGLVILSEIITEPNSNIYSLVLSENKFEYNSAKVFFKQMGSSKSIKELILMKCQIDSELADDLHQMLLSNNSLVSLSLYENKISDQEKFIKIIGTCQNFNTIEIDKPRNTLRNLDLSKNGCRLDLNDDHLLNLMKNLDIDMLDISGNVDRNEISLRFMETIVEKKDSTKILY